MFIIGFIYSVRSPKSIEKFENLSDETRTALGQKIRDKNGLESTIELINKQIEEREKKFSETKAVPPEEKKGETKIDNGVYSDKKTNLVNVDLKDYVHKSSIPNMSDYIHKNNVPDMTQYVKRGQMPDLNRYVLKTKIPPYPDMTKYILKNQVPKCPKFPDMNKYILKSQIPAPKLCPDMSKFVLKSSVPPFKETCLSKPDCVKCDEQNTKENTKENTKNNKQPKNLKNKSDSSVNEEKVPQSEQATVHNLIP